SRRKLRVRSELAETVGDFERPIVQVRRSTRLLSVERISRCVRSGARAGRPKWTMRQSYTTSTSWRCARFDVRSVTRAGAGPVDVPLFWQSIRCMSPGEVPLQPCAEALYKEGSRTTGRTIRTDVAVIGQIGRASCREGV